MRDIVKSEWAAGYKGKCKRFEPYYRKRPRKVQAGLVVLPVATL